MTCKSSNGIFKILDLSDDKIINGKKKTLESCILPNVSNIGTRGAWVLVTI